MSKSEQQNSVIHYVRRRFGHGVLYLAILQVAGQIVAAQPGIPRATDNSAEQLIATARQLRAEWRVDSFLRSIEQYKQARSLWKATNNRPQEAQALKELGQVFRVLSQYQNALDSDSEALRLYRGLRDRRGEAEVLADLGYVYMLLGQNERCLDYSRRALTMNKAIRDRSIEAQAQNNIGEAYYFLGDLSKSLDSAKRVSELLAAGENSRESARALSAIAWVYVDRGQTDKAPELFDQALKAWRAAKDQQGEAITINVMGSQFAFSGDYQRGLDLQKQALSMFRAIGDRRGEADALSKIGYTYFTLGELNKAITYYEEAAQIYRELSNRYLEGTMLANIGDVHTLLGAPEAALQKYDSALPLVREAGDRQWIAFILQSMGDVYLRTGLKPKALEAFQKARLIFRGLGNQRWEGNALNGIGSVYYSMGNLDKALDSFNLALAVMRKISDLSGESFALFNVGRVQRDRGDLEKARSNVEAALKINESIRARVMSQQSRASYFAATHQYYETYVDILMTLHKQKAGLNFDVMAFDASERARARSLLELLKEAGADIRTGVVPAVLEREQKLGKQLNEKSERQTQLLAEGSEAEAKAVSAEIDQLTYQIDEVESQIRATSPHYASMMQPQPLTLKEIQHQVLDDNSLLLQYSLGDKRSYLWAVTRDEVSTYELPGRAEIEETATNVYALLTANRPLPEETIEQRQARLATAKEQLPVQIAHLSSILLLPVAAKLGTKRLLIVPDGALQYIPFQVLNLAGGSSPLVVDHEIVNEPSASTLALLATETKSRQSAAGSVAVFADPVFEADDPRIASSARPRATSIKAQVPETDVGRAVRDVSLSAAGVQIPRLQASRDEANAIMSVAPWRSGFEAIGFAASRETAMKSDIGQYRIVHFATHGLLNDKHPELSGIVLSLFDEKGQPKDGFLRLHDIYNLKLPVDLVVLSACNTGLGTDVKGEGLIGLTRGFMYAGASSVVASLWKVDDEATAELMRLFYGYMLRDGLSPAAALRKAQVTMSQQKRWQSPYYWAGFVIQGQYIQSERVSRYPIYLVALWLMAAVVVGAAALYALRRRLKIFL